MSWANCTIREQLLSWRADDPGRRAGALALEVKGDFCHRVRKILEDAERDDDYLEIALPERGQFPSANHYYQTAPGRPELDGKALRVAAGDPA